MIKHVHLLDPVLIGYSLDIEINISAACLQFNVEVPNFHANFKSHDIGNA